MKRLVVVFAGLMVSLASAQSVDWDAAYARCPSQAQAYGADGRSTWQENRDFEASRIGQPVTAAKLRERLVYHKEIADQQGYDRPSYALNTCVLNAALNQLQSPPSRSAQQTAPSSSTSGRDRPDLAASRCVEFSSSRLRNNCNQTIAMNFCSDDYGTHACGNSNLGWAELAPGDSTYLSAQKAYWFACAKPARPTEVEYRPGAGLRAACTQ